MDPSTQPGSSFQSFGRLDPSRDGDLQGLEPGREAQGRPTNASAGVRDSVNSFVARGKDQVVGQVDATARALHGAASELEGGDTPQAARVAHAVAGQIDRATSYLRDLEPNRVLSDLERFARREPAMFIAGAAIAGVLLGRFLKASGSRGEGAGYEYDQGSNRPPHDSPSPFSTGAPVPSTQDSGPSPGRAGSAGEM